MADLLSAAAPIDGTNTPNWGQKAFDFAQDTTKQVIALAAGILTVTVTFHSDLQKAKVKPSTWPLQWSWVCYAVSILAGVLTLMALTGELEPLASGRIEPSINGWNVRATALLQMAAFVAGIALTALFAWWALSST